MTRHNFASVDVGQVDELIAMMDATDAWPAVTDARAWVLAQADVDGDAVVVDAGCGLGTFGRLAESHGAIAVDLDRSVAMVEETGRRRPGARIALGDIAHRPLRAGAARLVRAERVLQWTPDPHAALVELRRVTASGGWTAVTDTDWGTLAVDHREPDAAHRLAAAALRWVPHPRLARDLPRALAELGPAEVRVREDTVVISDWDPDDPPQRAGPPGLPLRSIAAAASLEDRERLDEDLAVLAADARRGPFEASLVLVTVAARR